MGSLFSLLIVVGLGLAGGVAIADHHKPVKKGQKHHGHDEHDKKKKHTGDHDDENHHDDDHHKKKDDHHHGKKEHKKHRHHKAHVHGLAQLSIAIEGPKAQMMFESPSEAIYGFEHKPENPKHKQIEKTETSRFKTHLDDLVVFPSDKGCKISLASYDAFANHEGDHSEVKAKMMVTCKKDLKGATLTFGFSKLFHRLKTLKVVVLSDSKQAQITVKNDKGSVKL